MDPASFGISPSFEIAIDETYVLRLPHIDQAALLYTLVDRNRLYLREYLPWVDGSRSPADSEAFIKSCVQQGLAGHNLHLFIWEGPHLIGLIGLHYIDRADRKAEIGYWLAEDRQGKGIMTTCCQRLISHCFEQLNLHRIEIRCQTANQRSQLIPQRLGFKCEGLLREALCLYGNFFDCLIYGLLSTDCRTAH